MLGEKAGWELNKDAEYCFVQTLKATLYKTAVLWIFTTQFTNKSKKDKLDTAEEVRINS